MTPEPRRTHPADAAREGRLAVGISRLVRAAGAAGARLASVVGWIRGVVTPVGWAVAAGALVGLALGYTWGWLELVVVGWGLAAVVAAAVLWLVGRGMVEIRLSLPTPRVAVGEPAHARLAAENPGRRRLIGMLVEVPVGDRVVERALPALGRGRGFEQSVAIPTDRRGVVSVGPVRTVRADPIGIVRREIVWSGTEVLHVHPRVVPIDALSSGFVRDLEGTPTRDLTSSDIAFHALREYLPGDDRRHIHWRSSAKTGTFMVRQYEETRRSRLMVILDVASSSYADADEFELAVSAAASMGVRAIRDARSLAFLVAGSDGSRGGMVELPTVSRDRLLDALCVVETDDRVMPLADLARSGAEALPGLSLVALVTGTAHGVAGIRAAAARLPAGVEVLGVVCAPEGSAAARQSGGTTVFRIGYLEDLRAMLARTAAVA
ncbi:DUF58 domain-containing protein [Agromyces sp. MMS24-K17]|uniref:DUF58 domain-containing protein n=1 Tax=Agromyces sp. MMS24-K17 TaxID=3372850 RepID=UPI003754D270